jgi:hypothetical protein
MTQQIEVEAVRNAAMALLPAAPPNAVLGALRALIDGMGMELDHPPDRAVGPLQAVQAAPRPAPAPATAPAKAMSGLQALAATQAKKIAEWETLRLEVRAARQARGMSMAELAKEIGASTNTTKSMLTSRRPASMRMQTRLTEWLKTPEVVPVDAAFRGNNGAGRGAGTARSTANGAARSGAGADHATA